MNEVKLVDTGAGPGSRGRVLVRAQHEGRPLASRISDRALLTGGAGVAAAGTLLGATAKSSALALLGIGLAGLGTSVCAPTLISLVGRSTAAEMRGSAVSIVTTIAYLGFLVGPAAVGLAAAASTLPTALAGVAALAALLAVGARFAPTPEDDRRRASATSTSREDTG